MWPDLVSNPGPLALESDVLPTALLGTLGQRSAELQIRVG